MTRHSARTTRMAMEMEIVSDFSLFIAMKWFVCFWSEMGVSLGSVFCSSIPSKIEVQKEKTSIVTVNCPAMLSFSLNIDLSALSQMVSKISKRSDERPSRECSFRHETRGINELEEVGPKCSLDVSSIFQWNCMESMEFFFWWILRFYIEFIGRRDSTNRFLFSHRRHLFTLTDWRRLKTKFARVSAVRNKSMIEEIFCLSNLLAIDQN